MNPSRTAGTSGSERYGFTLGCQTPGRQEWILGDGLQTASVRSSARWHVKLRTAILLVSEKTVELAAEELRDLVKIPGVDVASG